MIKGDGIPLNLDLSTPDHKYVDFGVQLIG